MCSIGILPSLASKPYMLERLIRDCNMQRVQGNHLHLVSNQARNPKAKTKPKFSNRLTDYTGPFGGDAA